MERAATALVSAARRRALQQNSSRLQWVQNYAAKDMRFGVKAKALVLQGVEQVAHALKVTMGPKGQIVVIEQGFGSPNVTKDDVTVAKAIEFTDRIGNVGVSLVKQVANAANDTAGNGILALGLS